MSYTILLKFVQCSQHHPPKMSSQTLLIISFGKPLNKFIIHYVIPSQLTPVPLFQM